MSIFICTTNQGKLEEFKQALNKPIYGIKNFNHQFIEPLENSNFFVCNAVIKLVSALKLLSIEENTYNIKNVIVDDSGLCVPDLNYKPGVHSATFGGLPRDDEKNNLFLIEKINECYRTKIYAGEKRLDAFFVCFLLSFNLSGLDDFFAFKDSGIMDAESLLIKNKKEIIKLETDLLRGIDLNLSSGSIAKLVPLSLFLEGIPRELKFRICLGFCSGEVSNKMQRGLSKVGHGYDPLFYPKDNRSLSFASITIDEKNKISHRAKALSLIRLS